MPWMSSSSRAGGRAPGGGVDLPGTQQRLEGQLVLGPVEDEPVRLRVAHAVAEDSVQPEGDLVDEVVHVALQTPVVIAGEQQAPVPVDEHPAGEVDGPAPPQVS